jgi:hypothetical protein
MLSTLLDACLSFDHEGQGTVIPREMAMSLLTLLVEKISEMKRYGQDLYTMDLLPMRDR